MAEERKDQDQPGNDDSVAAENETATEATGPEPEGATDQESKPEADQQDEQSATDRANESEGETEPEGPRSVAEDIGDAGETLVSDTPSAIVDEAVEAVEHEADKADAPEDETAGPGLIDESPAETEEAGSGSTPAEPVSDEPSQALDNSGASAAEDAGQALAHETPEGVTDETSDAMEHEADKADGEDLVEGVQDLADTEAGEGPTLADDQEDGGSRETLAAASGAAATGRQTTRRASTAPREPRVREPKPSRSAIAREERRRRSEARRRRRRIIYTVLGGSLAALLIAGLVLPELIANLVSPPALQEDETAGTPAQIQEGDIIEPGAEHAGYSTTPATSGPRYAEPLPWGVYDEPQPEEAIVRNLEMGGIAFNHNLADPQAIDELAAFVQELPDFPGCYVMAPHEGVPEGEVVLTAWGWMQEFQGVDTTEKGLFVSAHRNDGPEFHSSACGYEPEEGAPAENGGQG